MVVGLQLLFLPLPLLGEDCKVLLDTGDPLAAIFAEVPGTKACLSAEMAELEATLATVDPVVVVDLALNLQCVDRVVYQITMATGTNLFDHRVRNL